MTLQAKLNSLKAQVDTKILDSGLGLDNSGTLLQIAAYLKELTSESGGSGGSGSSGSNGGATEQTLAAINSSLSSLLPNVDGIEGLLAASNSSTSSILTFVNELETLVGVTNTVLGTINTRVNTLVSGAASTALSYTNSAALVSTANTATEILTASTPVKTVELQNISDSDDIYVGFTNAVTNLNGIWIPRFSSYSIPRFNQSLWAFKTSGNGRMALVIGV